MEATSPQPANLSAALSVALRANERLLETPAASCHSQITSDVAVGKEAGDFTVTLEYICTGYAYDHTGAAQVAASMLAQRASRELPAFFKLSGKINATVTSVVLTDPQQAVIRLTVAVQGTWALRL